MEKTAMVLTAEDRDWVKLIAAESAREIIKEVLLTHIASCPHGIAFRVNKSFLVGCCIGSGLLGGGAGAAIAKVLSSLGV